MCKYEKDSSFKSNYFNKFRVVGQNTSKVGQSTSVYGMYCVDGLFFQSKEHSPKKTLRNFYKIIKKLVENSLQ